MKSDTKGVNDKLANEGLSRRGFLQGVALSAGVVAAGAVGLGAAGCTPEASKGGDTGTSAGNKPTQLLNPQDYDYRSNSITDFESSMLFSSWQFASHTIPNRMVKTAAYQLAFMRNNPEEYITYYERMAKGGVGFIWTEYLISATPENPIRQNIAAYDMRGLADALHAQGAKVGYQFGTMGTALGPLEYTTPFIGKYTTEDVKTWIQYIIDLSKELQSYGYDAIEINSAGNNLPQSFLSRERNNRTDEYGAQSLENRTRFLSECISGIKQACGKDFGVQVLIHGIEEKDTILGDSTMNLSLEEAKAVAKIAEQAGADSLHIRIGPSANHEAQFASEMYFTARNLEGQSGFGSRFDFSRHFAGLLRSSHSGCGLNIDLAAAIKEAVSIPVGTACYMDPAHAPDYFETALKEGKIDFLCMNRPLCVDTEYVNKLRANKIDEIAPCTRCMHCFYDADLKGTALMEHCRVNAANWRAYGPLMPEGYQLIPLEGKKKVMVIGGGPAGMEAARIAAGRGADVTLYEKNAALGGLLPSAESIKGPHENLGRLAAYLTKQQELSGVTVVTGQEVDAALIKSEAPDAVILAAGGKRTSLGLTATASTKVFDFSAFFGADLGKKLVVWGGNVQAVDTAIYLAGEGYQVDLVAPDAYVVPSMFGLPPGTDKLKVFDKGHSATQRKFLIPALTGAGCHIYAGAKIETVGDGFIEITTESGLRQKIICDSLIDVSDMLPNTDLIDGLDDITTIAVGDCETPYNIAEAISSGNLAARGL